jgi:hypothetical protein
MRSPNLSTFAPGVARFASLAIALSLTTRSAVPDEAKEPPRAPADHVIFDTDRAGAYFIARPLKEEYDALLKRLATLREALAQARIDSTTAHREIDVLQEKLGELRGRIDATRLYIAGAPVHTRSETKTVPIGENDLLLIDAPNVEIRGGDGPEIKCIL